MSTKEPASREDQDAGQLLNTKRQQHNPSARRAVSRGALLLEQLRRRYEASKRLPPLPHNGRRDPAEPREACGWWR